MTPDFTARAREIIEQQIRCPEYGDEVNHLAAALEAAYREGVEASAKVAEKDGNECPDDHA